MKILGLDTSNKFLVITMMESDKVVYHKKLEVYRNASEITNYKIKEAFEEVRWKPTDLEAVVATRGPGSFTGIRIAMTIAKIITSTLKIPLYSLSSLNYYAGLSDTSVILDARSKKAYYGEYKDGNTIFEGILSLDDIKEKENKNIKGELSILGKEDDFSNLENNFINLKEFWKKESVFDAKPQYYKSNL